MKPSIAVARTALGIAAWAWAVVVAAHPLAAQDTAVHVGAGPLVAWPTGSLSAYLATGYGVGAFVEFAPTRALHLRLDADFVRFPPTTAGRPFRGLQPVEITTGSQLFAALAGPELRLPLGAVRLSAAVGAGFATSTNSGAVTGIATPDRFSGATTFGDLTWAYAAAGGAGVQLRAGTTPVWLDFAGRFVGTGLTRWVREGNIPVGYISGVYLKPTRSPTTLLSARLSVSVGLTR